MTKTLAALLALAMLSAVPAAAATQVANSSTSPLCTPEAPESYKRAGGYCDEIDNLKSLIPTRTEEACGSVADAGFRFDEIEGRLLVAEPIDPCCKFGSLDGIDSTNLPLAGIKVASACP